MGGHDLRRRHGRAGQVGGVIALDESSYTVGISPSQTRQPHDPPMARSMPLVIRRVVRCSRDGNLFGPVVPIDDDAAPLDKLLGLTGRDPGWLPPS